MTGGVEVDVAAVRAAWQDGEPATWLFVEAGGYSAALLEQVRAAAAMATRDAATVTPDEPPGVVVEELGAIPAGVALLVDVSMSGGALAAWAASFAGALAGHGVTARVTAATRPGVALPYAGGRRPCVTLGASLTVEGERLESPGNGRDFAAPRAAVEAVVGLALEWVTGRLPSTGSFTAGVLVAGRMHLHPLDGVLGTLRDVLASPARQPSPGTVRLADRAWWRQVTFEPLGRVLLETRDVDTGWDDLAAELTGALRRLAPFCDVGFVRRSRHPSNGWWSALGVTPPSEQPEAGAFLADTRPLDAEQVPAPYGVMVLREAHLARAGDLGPGWRVEPAGDGRFMVRADDVGPWFATDEPPPVVVAGAHSAFGDAVAGPDRYSEVVRPRAVPGWVAAVRRGEGARR